MLVSTLARKPSTVCNSRDAPSEHVHRRSLGCDWGVCFPHQQPRRYTNHRILRLVRHVVPLRPSEPNMTDTLLDNRNHRRSIMSYLKGPSRRTQVERTLSLLVESGLLYCALWVSPRLIFWWTIVLKHLEHSRHVDRHSGLHILLLRRVQAPRLPPGDVSFHSVLLLRG